MKIGRTRRSRTRGRALAGPAGRDEGGQEHPRQDGKRSTRGGAPDGVSASSANRL
jgi:hypothetical protein